MKGLVIHKETRQVLDFYEDDFGGPVQDQIIADWRERERKSGEPQTRPEEFICSLHQDHERPYLVLKRRPDANGNEVLWAAHWPGSGIEGACATHRPMTDEHRRLRDYAGRAAEDGGIPWKSEVVLPGARPDAVVYGSTLHMGIEAQRAYLSPPAAKGRTTRQRKAGVTPVWLLLPKAGGRLVGQVLTASVRHTDWTSMPPARSVVGIVSGIGRARCGDTPDVRCPSYPYCRRWHPVREPERMPVDEIVTQFSSGIMVPILFTTASGKRHHVHVVHRDDKAKYEAMTGVPADWTAVTPEPLSRQPARRIVCNADAGPPVLVKPAPAAPPTKPTNDPPPPPRRTFEDLRRAKADRLIRRGVTPTSDEFGQMPLGEFHAWLDALDDATVPENYWRKVVADQERRRYQ